MAAAAGSAHRPALGAGDPAPGVGRFLSPSSSSASVKGAVATLANLNGAGGNCIFQFETNQCYSVTNYEDFEYLMVRPLYMFGGNSNTSISVNYPLSPANAPKYSDGCKTVVINLKGWKWSDGESVDAKDLVFDLNLLEAEKANYAAYTPGLLPDNMTSYSATGPDQVTLQLKQGYSSIWFTYNQLAVLTPFPMALDVSKAGAAQGSGGCTTDSAADGWAKCRAVWTFLDSQNKDTSTYATNPLWQVVDGPFKLASYNVDGNYTFVPNKDYSGSPKPSIAELKFQTYISDTAVYEALKTGALSTGGAQTNGTDVPSNDLAPAGKGFLPPSNPLASAGYVLQTAYEFSTGFAYMNFNNPTYGPLFRQLYFRQALMELDNQAGMSKVVGRGYWYPTPAGAPPEPVSQWVSSDMTENGGQGPYPYDPARAQALLAGHGWQKVGGVLTCESAGYGASNCGAGIAKGTQAKFAMLYSSGIAIQADMADVLKSGLRAGRHPAHAHRPDVQHAAGLHRALYCERVALQLDVPVPGRLGVQRAGLRADRRCALPDRRAEQLRQLLESDDGRADQGHPHQQQPGHLPSVRQLHRDSGPGALDAVEHRRPGGQRQPAPRHAEPAEHVLPGVLDVQHQDLLTC